MKKTLYLATLLLTFGIFSTAKAQRYLSPSFTYDSILKLIIYYKVKIIKILNLKELVK